MSSNLTHPTEETGEIMLDVVIGIPLGIIGALAALIWITRRNHGTEPSLYVLHDPEKLDEQWRTIWNNGLDPVWNDHFGWMADGPSVVDKLRAVQQGPVITRDVDEIRAELDRRHLVQRDATGKTVINDYPQIGYL